jgi:gluconolactonase
MSKTYSGEPFLINRRVFAMAETGIPDGVKCDQQGNVYSGCGDRINVWSPGGFLLGKILIPGGVANFCFAQPGEILACPLFRGGIYVLGRM